MGKASITDTRALLNSTSADVAKLESSISARNEELRRSMTAVAAERAAVVGPVARFWAIIREMKVRSQVLERHADRESRHGESLQAELAAIVESGQQAWRKGGAGISGKRRVASAPMARRIL